MLTRDLAFLEGGGEMGNRIRTFDWAATPIGPVETWSLSLRMMVRFLLSNPYPMLLWWGPDYISIYNDPYRAILGTKHPWGLAQPVRECWKEIWHILQPLIDRPFKGGPATWNEDILLELHRNGFLEEGHFTIGYSPVPDDTVHGGIGGVLATVHEITGQVVGQRRVLVLRDLGAQAGEAKTAEDACALTARTVAQHGLDLPFLLLYLIDRDGKRARLAGAAGVEPGTEFSPEGIDLEAGTDPWSAAAALRQESALVVEALGERFAQVPAGPWSDPPGSAVVVPIPSNKPHEPAGLMVAGVSPRLQYDSFYHDFIGLLRTQVATAIANARAYEEERRRAEALAEMDRAKTAFFSNVSHEFRTPLTLMLGPLEDALGGAGGPLPPETTASLDVVHRNGLRLLRLVNSLLDFSGIEARRIQADFEPTELGPLTAELASNFRSACERAGLELVVNCPSAHGARPAYVDRYMWEKIVLNLVSNAFKYTHVGTIEVALDYPDGHARLAVRDTGVGIPAHELPRMFERFHRVKDSRGRTHEGSGIGLALVLELVKLHGGTVSVESTHGQGSVFTVLVPLGAAHLDPRHVRDVATAPANRALSAAFVEEALRWLPSASEAESGTDAFDRAFDGAMSGRILWADDNADMREYVSRLLGGAGQFEVIAVADGAAALEAARIPGQRPDLVLADIMMPRLDGFSLLRELRADARLSDIPVILLSARAGEGSRIEGLQAGADDYLVKPFSARELITRVKTHVKLARRRRDATTALRLATSELQEAQRIGRLGSWQWDAETDVAHGSDELLRIYGFDPAREDLPTFTEQRGRCYPVAAWEQLNAAAQYTLETGQGYELELPALRVDGSPMWICTRGEAVRNAEGRVVSLRGTAQDITQRKRAELALETADRRKNEFLALLAHELRNPLAPIRNAVQLLGSAKLERGVVESTVPILERQVSHMVRLVDDLLDVSRISQGRIELHRETVELAQVVDQALEASRPLYEEMRHQLVVTLPPRPIHLDADPVRLAQVLGNLLNNAGKFTNKGGQIRLTVEDAGAEVVLRVQDNGIGINPEQLGQIFEMFTQVDASLQRSQGGLGIGLTLVKVLVEIHGGSVGAHSEGPGKGSEFVVRLPALTRVPAARDPVPEPRATPRRRVLVVDDNRDSVDSLAMLLEQGGHEVHTACDGLAAVEAATRVQPDVILLDIGLPKLNGYEAARRIREELPRAGLVLAALTGWGQEEDRLRSEEAGFNAHLVKPVDLQALNKLLASAGGAN